MYKYSATIGIKIKKHFLIQQYAFLIKNGIDFWSIKLIILKDESLFMYQIPHSIGNTLICKTARVSYFK